MFANNEVEKHKFHQHKSPTSVYNINVNKIVVLNEAPLMKKFLNILLGIKMVKN